MTYQLHSNLQFRFILALYSTISSPMFGTLVNVWECPNADTKTVIVVMIYSVDCRLLHSENCSVTKT